MVTDWGIWNDLEKVKALADKFGPGYTVIKRHHRRTYNIIRTSREHDRLLGAEVMYRTTPIEDEG